MTAVADTSTKAEIEARRGALSTIRRGLSLSPELRRGLAGTVVIAVLATAGRVVVPITIQQIIDSGFGENGVDLEFVVRMTLLALGAVLITGLATGWMHVRLAKVSETALSGLRIRSLTDDEPGERVGS